MIRAITASFLAVLACNLCHADDQPKDNFAELQGTWTIVKLEFYGMSALEKDKPKTTMVIKDGKIISVDNEAHKDGLKLSKFLDPSKKLKTFTYAYERRVLFWDKDVKLTLYGIYEVAGDDLRV